MSEYRIYVLGVDAQIIAAVKLERPNDDAAIESARELLDGHDIEIWQEARIVAKLKSETK